MSAPNDGGPEAPEGMHFMPCMSLRDWFAGQALCGLLAEEYTTQSLAPRDAYKMADAMLVERTKGESVNAQLLADNARGAAYIAHLKKRIQELGGGE